MKIPRQAASVDTLGEWVGHADAAQTIESMTEAFDAATLRIGDLARQINSRHPDVPRGALYARLSRTLSAIHRHADYFRSIRYANSLGEHLKAHRAFGAAVAAITAAGTTDATVGDPIVDTIRESALRLGLPAFLAEGLYDAAGRRPLRAPLALDVTALSAVLSGIYSRLCREVGPVTADRMLADAIDDAGRVVPGFDPRQLL